MSQQIINLKGFRDFLPDEKRKRDYVITKFTEVFEAFGFNPIQTPTLESAELLMGKYGAEADKLIYNFEDRGERKIALRYDQTVPTTRVITQYRNNLPAYFRRYQIQSVFRAEKPQKGRFREFTQCDIDIFGARSNMADAEIVACAYAALKNIGFKEVVIKINDRKLLFNTLEKYATKDVDVLSIIQSIDKLDKMSEEDVIIELIKKGLEEKNAQNALREIKEQTQTQDLAEVIEDAILLGVKPKSILFSPTLARGLDYYTGVMYEFIIPQYGSGSCAGGGRYDNLINKLIGQDIPATGLAFGFDRVVEAADELGLIPSVSTTADVLVTIFSKETKNKSLEAAKVLRKAGVRTEVFAEDDKNLSKQFKYADQNKYEYVVVIGPDEMKENTAKIKIMTSGEEKTLRINEIHTFFKK